MEEKISQAEELLKLSALEKKEEAVNILIGISKQGDKKATAILAKCLKDRDGISAENEHEVVWCVKCGVRSEKCEVRSVKEAVRSVECEVRSEKCEV